MAFHPHTSTSSAFFLAQRGKHKDCRCLEQAAKHDTSESKTPCWELSIGLVSLGPIPTLRESFQLPYVHFMVRKFQILPSNSWTQLKGVLELFVAYSKLDPITTIRCFNLTCVQHFYLLYHKSSFQLPTLLPFYRLLQFHLPPIKKRHWNKF